MAPVEVGPDDKVMLDSDGKVVVIWRRGPAKTLDETTSWPEGLDISYVEPQIHCCGRCVYCEWMTDEQLHCCHEVHDRGADETPAVLAYGVCKFFEDC